MRCLGRKKAPGSIRALFVEGQIETVYAAVSRVLDPGDAALLSGFGHGFCHGRAHSLVKGSGQDVFGIQLFRADDIGDGISSRRFHLVVDVAGAHIQSAAEHAGEGQHVVDLVGEIAAACADDGSAALLGLVGVDLRHRVGAGEDHGVFVHGRHHLGGQDARGRQADEHIGALEHIGQGTLLLVLVGDLGHHLDLAVQVGAAIVHRAAPVDQDGVADAHGQQQASHCYSGSAQMAKDYIDMGFYIGIGGSLTFKNNKKTVEVVEQIPIEKILIETDAPYLAPVPYRGRRNDSRLLKYVVEAIGKIKNMDENDVCNITKINANRLFIK